MRKLALAWSSTERVPAMFKVAFATADRLRVNQHFGAAQGFAIYAIDGERAQLVELCEFAGEAGTGRENATGAELQEAAAAPACGGGVGHNPASLADRVASLSGCAAVYCLAVGGSAVRQLLGSNIQPVRLEEEIAIDSVLTELCKAVREGGVPWIDKLIKRDGDSQRFERMAEEGWQE
jgi:nitrogen fixation protein NifX